MIIARAGIRSDAGADSGHRRPFRHPRRGVRGEVDSLEATMGIEPMYRALQARC